MGLKSSFGKSQEASCISKYINTAYDSVVVVAENIEYIISIGSGATALGAYLGAYPQPPTERPVTGDPLELGDYYVNTTTSTVDYITGLSPTVWLSIDYDATVQQAQSAEASALAASLSEASAALSEANAATSASEADTSKDLASQYAVHPRGVLIPGTTDYSALHYSQEASDAVTSINKGLSVINLKSVSDMQSVSNSQGIILREGMQVSTGTMIWKINATEGISIPNGLYAHSTSEIRASDFGAVLDGITDDAGPILEAITYAGGRSVVIEKDTKISQLSYTGSVDLRTESTAKINIEENIVFNSTIVPWDTPISIYNSYLPGDPYLPDTVIVGLTACRVTFPNSNHGYVKGDVVTVASDDAYTWITLEARAGFRAVVAFIEDEVVWLDRVIPLEEEDDYSFTRITKYSDDKLKLDIRLEGVDEFASSTGLLYVQNYVDPDIKVVCDKSFSQCMTLSGCYGTKLNLVANNIPNRNQTLTKYGYGVVDKNSENSVITGSARNLRHWYTTTHGGSGDNPSDYGQTRNTLVTGAVGTHCIAPFDTHASGVDITFSNCKAIASLGPGYSNRSLRTTYDSCTASGSSDAAWQIYNGETNVTTSNHCRGTRMINCKSYGYKRGFKASALYNKSGEAFRFDVYTSFCEFYSPAYTESVYLLNADWYTNNDRIIYSGGSSVTEGSWTENNPIFVRSYVTLDNATVSGNDLRLEISVGSLNIYPFAVAGTPAVISLKGVTLDNSTPKQFSSYGEMVITRDIDGSVPSGGPLDYTSGLDNTFVFLEDVSVYAKNLNTFMRTDVSDFFSAPYLTSRSYGWTGTEFNSKITPWRIANVTRSETIDITGDADWRNAVRPLELHMRADPIVSVRCNPNTPTDDSPVWDSGTTYNIGDEVTHAGGVYVSNSDNNLNNVPNNSSSFWDRIFCDLNINSIELPATASYQTGQRISVYNESLTGGTVRITASNVYGDLKDVKFGAGFCFDLILSSSERWFIG